MTVLTMLRDYQLHVYLIWGQKGFGEGCAPINRQAWTSDLDPPVREREGTNLQSSLHPGSSENVGCKTEAVREGERPRSY